MKLDKYDYEKLFASGRWLVRMDRDGESYGGFQWKPLGKWTIAPDWNPDPVCGGGLHGQGPDANGYTQGGTRLCLCETGAKRVVVDGSKVKAQRAKIVATDGDVPAMFLAVCSLDLQGYTHPLPGLSR